VSKVFIRCLTLITYQGNNLKELPFFVWLAPRLTELDVSANKIEHIEGKTDGNSDNRHYRPERRGKEPVNMTPATRRDTSRAVYHAEYVVNSIGILDHGCEPHGPAFAWMADDTRDKDIIRYC